MIETSKDTETPQYNAAEIGALAPLYRGEMYRSSVWRTRIDTTSNWALVTAGIALSLTFSDVQATPLPIVLMSFLLAAFLLFEARRYQYFDIWHTRLRVIERCFYDPMLRGRGTRNDSDWNDVLADDLNHLRLHMGLFDAIGLRLRRNYGWIFAIQIVSYWGKLAIHPTPISSLPELFARAGIGPVPGQIVLRAGAVFYLTLLAIGLLTLRGQRAVGRAHRAQAIEDRLQRLAETEHY